MTDRRHVAPAQAKTPTGTIGMDEITHVGRPTLPRRGPGCSTTILAAPSRCCGAVESREQGRLVSFEEGPLPEENGKGTGDHD